MASSTKVLDEWSPLARVYCPLKAGSIDGTDTEPHDEAVVRAMKATYKPNHLVQGEPSATLFVARLHPETTEEELGRVFSKYGRVERTRLIRDVVTGFSKRYAFVEFETEDDARYAFRQAQSIDIDGVQVYVDYEIERTLKGWVPRRLGGGFGGKKESGQLRFGGRDRPFRKPIVVARAVSNTGGRDVLRLQEGDRDYDRRPRDWRETDTRRERRRSRSRSRERSRRDERDRRYSRETQRPDGDRGRYDKDRRNERDYDRKRDRSRDRRRSRSR